MYQRRQDHLHALIYILFARNNLNEWFELTQTTHFSYNFTLPKSNLASLIEMQLLAVSNYGVIDHISLNVSSLECDAEKSSIAEPLTSNLTEKLQRFRRTFRNDELNNLMALIQNPPDRLFLPLVIGCLILALACIFMLVLLIFKSMFKNRNSTTTAAAPYLNYNSISDPDAYHSSCVLNYSRRDYVTNEEEMSEKDFSVFTIYEPDLISTHPNQSVPRPVSFSKHPDPNTKVDDIHHIKHTKL